MTQSATPGPDARIDVSAEEIDRVVALFYARIRAHHLLGPVFAAHVDDWESHEAKIAGFWKGAIMRQPGYAGSPMSAHRRAGNVLPGHFPVWLALFDDTLRSTISDPVAAAGWSALAHRIGAGLRAGVADVGRKPGEPPRLV